MNKKYRPKAKDSFKTKMNIFIYHLSIDDNLINISDEEFKTQFEDFKLDSKKEIIHSYESVYYQNEYLFKIGNKTINEIFFQMKDWKKRNEKLIKAVKEDYVYNTFPKLYPEEQFDILIKKDKCAYCEITKGEIDLLRNNEMLLNKHETRGYSLEIDRKEPNLEYTPENCVMSCFWCNNAKTDEFNYLEFKIIAKSIKQIWDQRIALVKGV